jgi:serine/threonine protein kinase
MPPIDESNILALGTTVGGRYQIERCIGSGGMGAVYVAKDTVIKDEIVALKVLHAEHVADQKQSQRFLREVQLMRRVNHQNVVRTFDLGSDVGSVFFTMEYVSGKPLETYIVEENFPTEHIPELIIQICEGLEAIHKAGIVHRDLKPANILLTEDFSVKITDFGVARTEHSELTAHNEIIGSALYIAPEVWIGSTITHAVDLYSLGVILYELTTGTLPFDGESPASLMKMHIEYQPHEPKELNEKISPWLNKLIMQLLEKTPAGRPKDAREVIEYVKQNTARFDPKKSLSIDGAEQAFLETLEQSTRQSLINRTPEQPHLERSLPRPPQQHFLVFKKILPIVIWRFAIASIGLMIAGFVVSDFSLTDKILKFLFSDQEELYHYLSFLMTDQYFLGHEMPLFSSEPFLTGVVLLSSITISILQAFCPLIIFSFLSTSLQTIKQVFTVILTLITLVGLVFVVSIFFANTFFQLSLMPAVLKAMVVLRSKTIHLFWIDPYYVDSTGIRLLCNSWMFVVVSCYLLYPLYVIQNSIQSSKLLQWFAYLSILLALIFAIGKPAIWVNDNFISLSLIQLNQASVPSMLYLWGLLYLEVFLLSVYGSILRSNK